MFQVSSSASSPSPPVSPGAEDALAAQLAASDEGDLLPTVAQYYSGKSLFVTGATGFIGKVLIDKLLRCCPDIQCIYLLMRAKKGQTVQERLADLVQAPVFKRLREERPGFESQLQAVEGDIQEAGLGLSHTDRQLLADSVQIVIHSAATIRFDEQLRLALQLNVIAVQSIIQLCRECKQLEVFVHVSTAYSNCDRRRIEEQIYPLSIDPYKLIACAEWMTDEMLDKITPALLAGSGKPNTYTFTKHMAELVLQQEAMDLPLAIVRPSIVTAALREPEPGWIDNLNGPSGLYVATGKGLLKTMKAVDSAVADIIPVDFPVNVLVTVAWYTAVGRPSPGLIYHSTTGDVNPCTWGMMGTTINDMFHKTPLDKAFRRPGVSITERSWAFDYWVFVSHMIPAYLADMGLRCLGKRPRMVKLYNRLHRAISTLDFFTCRSWNWSNNNLGHMAAHLSSEDRKTFFLDPRAIDWHDYLENYCMGTKKFLMKEDLAGVPAARAHLRKLRNIRYVFNTLALVLAWRLVIARSQPARNLWFFAVHLVSRFLSYFRISSTMRA